MRVRTPPQSLPRNREEGRKEGSISILYASCVSIATSLSNRILKDGDVLPEPSQNRWTKYTYICAAALAHHVSDSHRYRRFARIERSRPGGCLLSCVQFIYVSSYPRVALRDSFVRPLRRAELRIHARAATLPMTNRRPQRLTFFTSHADPLLSTEYSFRDNNGFCRNIHSYHVPPALLPGGCGFLLCTRIHLCRLSLYIFSGIFIRCVHALNNQLFTLLIYFQLATLIY